jgi:3-oxoadipate enol-lactonase
MIEFTADDGTRLAAGVYGPKGAPALLLLHSLGCDHHMWAPQIEALSASMHIIALDTRGHGGSAAPHGDYALDLLAGDALALLDVLGVARAHVCGLSLGGAMAQYLAIHAPARVDRLVLANTASRIGSFEAWRDRAAAVLSDGMAVVADATMARFFSPAFHARQAATVAQFRAGLLAIDTQGYAGCCAALRDADQTADLPRITAPTLVIGGDTDPSTPPEQARALAAAIPGATLCLLECAHLSNIEQPDGFTAALRAHLSEPG